MESSAARILVVANKTAATPALLEAVRERASRGPCEFTLLVPNATHGLHKVVDPEDQSQTEAETTIELALPLLEQAAGTQVDAMIGVPEPLAAIQASASSGVSSSRTMVADSSRNRNLTMTANA